MNIETPCLVIDIDKVNKNLKRMQDICDKNNCKLRPHTKTHKTPELAKLQLEYGCAGITVAKLSEAEVMAENGINDIFMAYPLIGETKILRAITLAKRGVRLICAADCYESSKAISDICEKNGIKLELRLEVDTGMHRTGIPYDKAVDEAVKIAALPGIILQGIFTFRGMIYNGGTSADLRKCAYEEGQLMVTLAEQIRAKGIAIEDVSVGSTPTGEFCAEVPGVTEVRPGTYIFHDMMQINTNACSCTIDDVAAVILTQVVSTCKPEAAVIDAGCKSVSTDVAPGKFPYNCKGYGIVLDRPDLYLERVSEEHGMLHSEGEHNLKTGELLRIIPNHICPVVNLYDYIYIEKNGKIVGRYKIAARGKNY